MQNTTTGNASAIVVSMVYKARYPLLLFRTPSNVLKHQETWRKRVFVCVCRLRYLCLYVNQIWSKFNFIASTYRQRWWHTHAHTSGKIYIWEKIPAQKRFLSLKNYILQNYGDNNYFLRNIFQNAHTDYRHWNTRSYALFGTGI